MFRPRLYKIANENELFSYFEKHASKDERNGIYTCAGVIAADPSSLFVKLIEEWKQDQVDEATRVLAACGGVSI